MASRASLPVQHNTTPPPQTPDDACSPGPPSYAAAVFSPPGCANDGSSEHWHRPTTSASLSQLHTTPMTASSSRPPTTAWQTTDAPSTSAAAAVEPTAAAQQTAQSTAQPTAQPEPAAAAISKPPPSRAAVLLLRSQVSVCSSSASQSSEMCRICHCEAAPDTPLITPCYCAGSLKYVHQHCLQQWIKSSGTKSCEVCRYLFIMETKMKPFNKWEKLDISPIERRKLLCSVAFHAVALLCVTWSLYILILQNIDEIQQQKFEWAFWTKLVVVAVGFTGAAVFMYVQCRMYLHLCKRWRAYNKVIFVQNCPERQPSKNPPVNFETSGSAGRTGKPPWTTPGGTTSSTSAAGGRPPHTAIVLNCAPT